ncbi:hypothetical protein BESB_013210 [Besnoitia besnoiti]|uniref:Uncharacterized protein n=1 Tax=Besnoitia besnoiti TaxID=94643 RepID=A0A2A9M435_BESBE|nr:hypothetical protein BESB_013210 [Besnoitia besnoiti]PFH32709.1 hypothetical protein BESB_013210 [Besnoitia besnoiti]
MCTTGGLFTVVTVQGVRSDDDRSTVTFQSMNPDTRGVAGAPFELATAHLNVEAPQELVPGDKGVLACLAPGFAPQYFSDRKVKASRLPVFTPEPFSIPVEVKEAAISESDNAGVSIVTVRLAVTGEEERPDVLSCLHIARGETFTFVGTITGPKLTQAAFALQAFGEQSSWVLERAASGEPVTLSCRALNWLSEWKDAVEKEAETLTKKVTESTVLLVGALVGAASLLRFAGVKDVLRLPAADGPGPHHDSSIDTPDSNHEDLHFDAEHYYVQRGQKFKNNEESAEKEEISVPSEGKCFLLKAQRIPLPGWASWEQE